MSFFEFISGTIGDAIVGITGGNIFLIGAVGLLGFAIVMFRFNMSMPFALMAGFFGLAVLSRSFDNPNDPIIGTGNIGIVGTLFSLLVLMVGILIWHLFFKKSQAGVG